MRDLASVGGGLGYRLVRKHARTEMLGLLISMFLGLGYMVHDVHYKNCIHYP